MMEHEKVRTFSIDITEALLATLKDNEASRENVRKIMYRRVDDFITEATMLPFAKEESHDTADAVQSEAVRG